MDRIKLRASQAEAIGRTFPTGAEVVVEETNMQDAVAAYKHGYEDPTIVLVGIRGARTKMLRGGGLEPMKDDEVIR